MPRRRRSLLPAQQGAGLLLLHPLRPRQRHDPVLRSSSHKDQGKPHVHHLRHPEVEILEQLPPLRRPRDPDPLLRLPASDVALCRVEAQVGGSGHPAAFERRHNLLRALFGVQTLVRERTSPHLPQLSCMTYCCSIFDYSRHFPTFQRRKREIKSIHANPAYAYYWQKVGA